MFHLVPHKGEPLGQKGYSQRGILRRGGKQKAIGDRTINLLRSQIRKASTFKREMLL
jgi:hypothetical protein